MQLAITEDFSAEDMEIFGRVYADNLSNVRIDSVLVKLELIYKNCNAIKLWKHVYLILLKCPEIEKDWKKNPTRTFSARNAHYFFIKFHRFRGNISYAVLEIRYEKCVFCFMSHNNTD